METQITYSAFVYVPSGDTSEARRVMAECRLPIDKESPDGTHIFPSCRLQKGEIATLRDLLKDTAYVCWTKPYLCSSGR